MIFKRHKEKKNKLKRTLADYKQLRNKIFFSSATMLLLAVLITYSLYRLIFFRRFGDAMVDFLYKYIYQDYELAYVFYSHVFRNYMHLFFQIAIVLIFLLILKLYLRSFIKYFSEIDRGIDYLIAEGEEELTLLPELAAAEKKINYIKHTLALRKQAAWQAEQRKNDLVMYLAHDIRTPLTSVIGYLDLLKELPELTEEHRAKYIDIALSKACRLEKMFNEFFEITRYNLQEISIEKEEIDLYYMLVQLTDELSPELSAHGNTTVLQAPENLTVQADPDKLARVFNNVLKNAATYSYPNTPIVISAWEQEQGVVISFVNQGPDLPPEKLNDIFEKFYRLDSARTSNTGGSGLGLAIAREIVNRHGGTITAASACQTVTFTITLPVTV